MSAYSDLSDLRNLADCVNSRDFLSQALAIRYRPRGKPNVADFSRRAGFASRSFLTEYLSGKKGLSADALFKIKSCLKLPSGGSRLFELMVYSEQKEIRPRHLNPETIQHYLEDARRCLREAQTRPAMVKRVVERPLVLQVFAGLGALGIGATLAEVQGRTRLPMPKIKEALQLLISHGLVELKDARYVVCTDRLDFLGLDIQDGLASMIDSACADIRKNLEAICSKSENTLLYTAFSVRRARVPQFKQELRDAIFSVIDKFQEEPGDSVEQLFLCARGPDA